MTETINFRGTTYRIEHFGLVSPVMERKRPSAYLGAIPDDELEFALAWLSDYAQPLAKKRAYSCGLKHIAEKSMDDYIGNGPIFLAALRLGYRVEPEYPLSPQMFGFMPNGMQRGAVKMTDWKATEQTMTKRLNRKWLGATVRHGADILTDWLADEVKHRRKFPQWLKDALDQAASGTGDRLPVVVLHEYGQRHLEDLVLLRLAEFEA